MKAAIVHDFASPLHIEDVPIPEPGIGEIVVKIEASSLCHTNIAEVFELHAAGKTRVIYETRKLEEVNHSFEEIEQGRIPARLVFDMA